MADERRLNFSDMLRVCDHEKAETQMVAFRLPDGDRAWLAEAARLTHASRSGLLRLGVKLVVAEVLRRYGEKTA